MVRQANQKHLSPSFPGEYTPEQLAEIDTTRRVLFEAERLLRWHNMEWRKVLGNPHRDYRLDLPAPVFAGYQRVQKVKHERRLARQAVANARIAYCRAVNEPLAHNRTTKAVQHLVSLGSSPKSLTAFAAITHVSQVGDQTVFEGTLASGAFCRETIYRNVATGFERHDIVITNDPKKDGAL